MKRLLLISIIFCTLSFLAYSQEDVYDEFINKNYKGEIGLEINSGAFFDNLEFYNDIQRGYTLPGFYIEPRLKYVLGSKASISGGFHSLYFAGEKRFSKIVPVLTLQASLFNNLTLNVGTIESVDAHNLPEPLFKKERTLIKQPETGLQFILNTNHLTADSWINWEHYIRQGDTIQEEFTAGFSAIAKGITLGSVELELPIYGLAVHQGGQINISNQPVSTLANFGGGLNVSYINSSKNRFGIELKGFLGRDLSPNPHHTYKKGWAFYPKVFFRSNLFIADLGYWRASELILPRGEEIYGSLSMVDPIYNTPERELLTSSLQISKELAKGFKLAFASQFYYDIANPMLDYRFSISITFKESFSILTR